MGKADRKERKGRDDLKVMRSQPALRRMQRRAWVQYGEKPSQEQGLDFRGAAIRHDDQSIQEAKNTETWTEAHDRSDLRHVASQARCGIRTINAHVQGYAASLCPCRTERALAQRNVQLSAACALTAEALLMKRRGLTCCTGRR